MRLQMGSLILCATGLLIFACLPLPAFAQHTLVLTGTVRNEEGTPVAGAHVSARNTQSGETVQAVTAADGGYVLHDLVPGGYVVTFTAEGFAKQQSAVTITGAGKPTLDMRMVKAGAQQELPNAPPVAPPQEPTLQSLGFTAQQTQANPKLQARLDKRTEMLKMHQRLGLITLAPMVADLVTGPMAKAKGRNGQPITEPTQTNLDLHAALGSSTVALYATTACLAIFAPKVPGVQKRGAIRMHEALAFIHGPGMILTPILGGMAFDQEQNGEKVHGIASAHGTVAAVTVITYGASIVAVAWPIHLKFWKR